MQMKGSYKLGLTVCFQPGDAAAIPRLESMLLLATDALCVFNKPSGISVQVRATARPFSAGLTTLLHGRRVELPRMHTLTPGPWLHILPQPRGPCPFLPAWCIALTKVADTTTSPPPPTSHPLPQARVSNFGCLAHLHSFNIV
jgi:hypothetical protein